MTAYYVDRSSSATLNNVIPSGARDLLFVEEAKADSSGRALGMTAYYVDRSSSATLNNVIPSGARDLLFVKEIKADPSG